MYNVLLLLYIRVPFSQVFSSEASATAGFAADTFVSNKSRIQFSLIDIYMSLITLASVAVPTTRSTDAFIFTSSETVKVCSIPCWSPDRAVAGARCCSTKSMNTSRPR